MFDFVFFTILPSYLSFIQLKLFLNPKHLVIFALVKYAFKLMLTRWRYGPLAPSWSGQTLSENFIAPKDLSN